MKRKSAAADAAAALGRLRWAGLPEDEPARVGALGGKSAWSGLTAIERSAEMRRRAAKRRKGKKP